MSTPIVPPPGTALDRDAAAAVAAALDSHVATIASQLVDLDADVQAFGSDTERADVAAAFALWRAVSERAAEWDGIERASEARRREVLAAAWQPVRTASGEQVAPDLADGLTFLDALVQRLHDDLARRRDEAAAVASTWIALDADLRRAEQAAARLGEEVRHIAELARAAAAAPHAAAPPPDLVARAAEARQRLERAEAERDELLDQLDAAPAALDDLTAREAEVRTLAAACREKIVDAPNIAVPSVAAIGEPPADARQRPWHAVQADVREYLRTLARVDAALDEAQRRFQSPLDRRDELRGLLQAFRDKAASADLAEHETLDGKYQTARDTLWSAPCDLERASAEVDDYVRTVNSMMHGVN